jgi:alkaline phosphatase
MRRHRLRLTLFAIVMIVAATVASVALTGGSNKAAADPIAPDFSGVKNVILFIGDGMADAHLQVGRQLNGGSLMMDRIFASANGGYTGFTDTTSLDGVTDSAAGGTALSTGEETWNDWVAMGPADPDNPKKDNVEPWQTVLERAQGRTLNANGTVGPKGPDAKAVGLITDLELSDATPAVFTAHVEDRDEDVSITRQMNTHDIEVLCSGGWGSSYILGDPDVTSLRQMNRYLRTNPKEMLGIFAKSVLAYTLDREEEEVDGKQPTLPELTRAAIDILKRAGGDDGFFVMIEAGSNDWGGHARDAAWIGAEIRELDQAVKVAYDWAKGRSDTLIVVTADHECGGLGVSARTRYDLIADQTATTEWMWGLIKKSGAGSIPRVLSAYAGVPLGTRIDTRTIWNEKEMGISNFLANRYAVTWGWGGTDEGDHTATNVPVMAWGRGARAFGSIKGDDSEWVGKYLLDAVSQPVSQ